VSSAEVILLGAIAGATIFIGLPVGRIRGLSVPMRSFLNAASAGVLVFLLVETISHGFEPVEVAVEESQWDEFAARGLIFLSAFAFGLLGLVYYERWMVRRREALPQGVPMGPGAASVHELSRSGIHGLSEAKRTSLFIAIGIGLHNLAEGLAIGQSAANDAISLAVLLVVGFALHNATEGFGIVAPLAAEDDRPSWAFLLMMGVIGGGPTFLGTVVGRQFTSDAVSVVFLTLAAGSILYVIVQLLGVAHRAGRQELLHWGLLVGLAAGFITDMVVTAGGA